MEDVRSFFEGRDVQTRCVCGHLLFIHVDANRRVLTGDEPPHGIVIERKGHCMHAECCCKLPRTQTPEEAPPVRRGARGATTGAVAATAAVRRDVA